ncbi:MAG TPA: 1,2-phenylacetyl-CoA epoxidase subunit PaaD [Chitinophagaceae bacterium]|nr:1,2-phenylacetyl-CoA epoxidase subunit PaaD [Chitinophagaceae bacterium]
MGEDAQIKEAGIWAVLEQVTDPEVPVLSVVDLGIVRKVDVAADNTVTCIVTPTYSGCPATDVININIRLALLEAGFAAVNIQTVLSPAWTTEWMSEAGKQKLKDYGIAPPNVQQVVCTIDAFQQDEAVQCPRCGAYHTTLISRFGSTACKALYKCEECKEPFDYFKCH